MRFFFYGTLIDPDVRRFVLGARAPEAVEPATLAGWRRSPVRGATFPIIRRRAGARVGGVLARGLDAEARRLLVAYESEGYAIVAVEVARAGGRRIGALAFVPSPGSALRAAPGAWRFADWEKRHKRDFLARLAAGGAPPRG